MKRNIDGPTPAIPALVEPQATTSPAPSKPANESAPPPPTKSSTEKTSPFTNISAEKAAKLSALEASGATGYVVVSSPKVYIASPLVSGSLVSARGDTPN